MAGFDAAGMEGGTGLSKHIRALGISETYDLAGFGEAQTRDLVRDTFAQPIRATEPIRFTFLSHEAMVFELRQMLSPDWSRRGKTLRQGQGKKKAKVGAINVMGIGGGKTQNRQKYDSDLGRYMTAALREIGFREDRAATALLECQGSYKSQHDTHKGIRTLQVFPKIDLVEEAGEDGGSASQGGRSRITNPSSPEYMAIVCTFDTFQEMVQEKVCSWSQKKRLLRHLGTFVARHKQAEQRLMKMEALSQEDQDIYDNVDTDVAQEKIAWLTSLVKAMVEHGQLTKEEREQVLAQIQSKLENCSVEQEEATLKQDEVKLARIHKQADQLIKRRSMVNGHAPIAHKVKHQDELRSITAKLIKIEKLENTRGRLLTIDEVKQVGLKGELQDRATLLENDSRGWFEEDEELEARLAEVRKQGQRMAAKAAGGSGKGGKAAGGGSAGRGRGEGGGMAMDSDGWSRVKR